MSAWGYMEKQAKENHGATLTTVALPTKTRMKPFAQLLVEVIRKNICDGCGACIATCPVSVIDMKPAPGKDELPSLVGRCILCQYCYYSCPRIELHVEDSLRNQFPQSSKITPYADIIGPYIEAYSARTKREDIRARATDGGVVTSIMAYVLNSGMIDSSVSVRATKEQAWKGEPKVALTYEELLETGGTVFDITPVHEGLREAWEEYDSRSIGVVGLPCQIFPIKKMQSMDYGYLQLGERVKLTIGLFCAGAFYYEGIVKELLNKQKGIPAEKISKMNIKRGKFVVEKGRGKPLEIPLTEINAYRRVNCNSCPYGFSAWQADISLGSIGSKDDWTTALTRTPLGREAFKGAVEAGYIECVSLDDVSGSMEAIVKHEMAKKRRLDAAKAAEAAAATQTPPSPAKPA
ncbi:MAG: Coenzyme F420 hydrogenase/dehydrogenase, beta subunit C-terminal domain [Candidatus Bathyarchaeia archaeon]